MIKKLFFCIILILSIISFCEEIQFSKLNFSKNIKFNKSNIDNLLYYKYQGPIKIEYAICFKNPVNRSIYDYCYAIIDFINQKTFHMCTYTKQYCKNLSFNKTIAYIKEIPSNLIPIISNSKEDYSSYTKFKNTKVVNANLIYINGIWGIISIEPIVYHVNLLAVILFILVCIIAYILWKNKKGE